MIILVGGSGGGGNSGSGGGGDSDNGDDGVGHVYSRLARLIFSVVLTF